MEPQMKRGTSIASRLSIVALTGLLIAAGAALGGGPAAAGPDRVSATPGAGAPDRVSARPGAGAPDRVPATRGKVIRDHRDAGTPRGGRQNGQVRVIHKKPTIANPAGYQPRNPNARVIRAVTASARNGDRVGVAVRIGRR
jgi:hypothetical protein